MTPLSYECGTTWANTLASWSWSNKVRAVCIFCRYAARSRFTIQGDTMPVEPKSGFFTIPSRGTTFGWSNLFQTRISRRRRWQKCQPGTIIYKTLIYLIKFLLVIFWIVTALSKYFDCNLKCARDVNDGGIMGVWRTNHAFLGSILQVTLPHSAVAARCRVVLVYKCDSVREVWRLIYDAFRRKVARYN